MWLLRGIILVFLMVVLTGLFQLSYSQITERGRQLETSQQFRLGDRIVRIAEPGQLADTLNVWGDVNSPGRYLIPRGTTLPELISYSLGPRGIFDRETSMGWSKMRIEVNVSEYNRQQNHENITSFKYRYNEPLPEGMRTFRLDNNQVVTVEVKRRAGFMDYLRVGAPVLSSIFTGLLIVDRLSN